LQRARRKIITGLFQRIVSAARYLFFRRRAALAAISSARRKHPRIPHPPHEMSYGLAIGSVNGIIVLRINNPDFSPLKING
jgi:hypothetical protein